MSGTVVKRLAALFVVGAASLSLTSTASASVGGLDGVCAFTGHANVFAAPVKWQGGGGSFGFSTNVAVCAGHHNGTALVKPAITIDASGTYASLVCGTSVPLTGDATGVATLTEGAATLGNSNFRIPFVAGQGIITGVFQGDGEFADSSGLTPGFVTIFPETAATQPVTGGDSPNQAQNPTPVDLSALPTAPITGAVFSGGQAPGSPTTSDCVTDYGVAGAFALVG